MLRTVHCPPDLPGPGEDAWRQRTTPRMQSEPFGASRPQKYRLRTHADAPVIRDQAGRRGGGGVRPANRVACLVQAAPSTQGDTGSRCKTHWEQTRGPLMWAPYYSTSCLALASVFTDGYGHTQKFTTDANRRTQTGNNCTLHFPRSAQLSARVSCQSTALFVASN